MQKHMLSKIAVATLFGVAACAGLASLRGQKGWWMSWTGLAVLFSGFGAFTAARQSWLQWFPPEVSMCGRDFFGMIENYPIRRAIPMIFKGSGDCSAVDWTFLGGTIANWSFVWFVIFGGAGIFAALEWNNPGTLGGLTPSQKLMTALFKAATPPAPAPPVRIPEHWPASTPSTIAPSAGPACCGSPISTRCSPPPSPWAPR